jgi:hypothetical protein
MNRELAKMYELIEKIETAILVTRRGDLGAMHPVSGDDSRRS